LKDLITLELLLEDLRLFRIEYLGEQEKVQQEKVL
jgi:hypothetical protein